jgi:alkanesulfonate monooxygenase SsuD/methylene tetrahydromethanopterin reductase-like flavin-dependent oxidoreductase (luciferase family)
MDEALRVLRTCWRGQTKVSFKGKYYQFQDMVFSPPPLQPGGPPLWVAGDSSIALRRAILLGDGWHPNASTAARLKTQLETNRTLINNRPFTVAVRFRLDFEEKDSAVGGLTGSPQEIINTLKDYQDAGMQVALINFAAKNQNDRERAMRRFMQDIKPALV